MDPPGCLPPALGNSPLTEEQLVQLRYLVYFDQFSDQPRVWYPFAPELPTHGALSPPLVPNPEWSRPPLFSHQPKSVASLRRQGFRKPPTPLVQLTPTQLWAIYRRLYHVPEPLFGQGPLAGFPPVTEKAAQRSFWGNPTPRMVRRSTWYRSRGYRGGSAEEIDGRLSRGDPTPPPRPRPKLKKLSLRQQLRHRYRRFQNWRNRTCPLSLVLPQRRSALTGWVTRWETLLLFRLWQSFAYKPSRKWPPLSDPTAYPWNQAEFHYLEYCCTDEATQRSVNGFNFGFIQVFRQNNLPKGRSEFTQQSRLVSDCCFWPLRLPDSRPEGSFPELWSRRAYYLILYWNFRAFRTGFEEELANCSRKKLRRFRREARRDWW